MPTLDNLTDSFTRWIGSTASLVLHTLLFVFSFAAHWIFQVAMDSVLLILTTAVSLEAIYLAIFIQRAVNLQGTRLHEVEESIDDVEESLDDVEEAIDEVEEDLEESEANQKKTGRRNERLLRELYESVQQIKEKLDAR